MKLIALLSILLLNVQFVLAADKNHTQTESVLGEWHFFLPSPDGVKKVTAIFQKESNHYLGHFQNEEGRQELNAVNVEGAHFSFEHEVSKFFMTITLTFNGEVKGDAVEGAIDTPKGEKSFYGIRK